MYIVNDVCAHIAFHVISTVRCVRGTYVYLQDIVSVEKKNAHVLFRASLSNIMRYVPVVFCRVSD